MARVTNDLTGAGETIELDIPEDQVGYGGLQYGTGGLGTLVIEGIVTDGSDWLGIGIKKAIDDTVVASVAAAGLYYFSVFGYNKIRVRKSVAGAGEVKVGLSFNPIK